MKFQAFYDSPFILNFSFEKLIQKMEAEASDNPEYALSHQRILDKTKEFPELLHGITNLDFFEKNEILMKELLR
ncbi:MAG: hypothetical protein E2600_10370, partial [Chryseobacterium sp.]|nr:hypothetical protein [Chryseobacterium sp.]